ncbi:hypothetical protein CIK05_06080 [Bdellovibrio sp. qaytius]|nr:hypothetical protein CIK05_06080 [Bdellovibrio sp. qaytius]
MQSYKGSCHCKNVQYEVQMSLEGAFECNCSICSKKGTVLAMATPQNFKLISGAEAQTNYQFYKKAIHHTFCKTCGVTSFVKGSDPAGNEMIAINVRCLDGVDIKSMKLGYVDGKSF